MPAVGVKTTVIVVSVAAASTAFLQRGHEVGGDDHRARGRSSARRRVLVGTQLEVGDPERAELEPGGRRDRERREAGDARRCSRRRTVTMAVAFHSEMPSVPSCSRVRRIEPPRVTALPAVITTSVAVKLNTPGAIAPVMPTPRLAGVEGLRVGGVDLERDGAADPEPVQAQQCDRADGAHRPAASRLRCP